MTTNPYMRYVRDYDKINLYKKKYDLKTTPQFSYNIILINTVIIIVTYFIFRNFIFRNFNWNH